MIEKQKLIKICELMCINSDEVIKRKTQKVDHVQARYLFFLYLKEYKKMTLKEIGKQFTPKYDHTSVINGIKRINEDINNPAYEHLVYIYEKIKPEPFTSLKYKKV